MLEWLLGAMLGLVPALCLLCWLRCPWIVYDVQHLYILLPFFYRLTKQIAKRDLMIDAFERRVKATPHRVAVLWGEERVTWAQLDEQACRVARVLQEEGVGPGDVAALMVLNEPAFIYTLLGLLKLGAQVALINYHLRQKALVHSVTCCRPKILVVGSGSELSEALEKVLGELEDVKVCSLERQPSGNGVFSLADRMLAVSAEPLPASLRQSLKMEEPCVFIFTSGTTGLPKPAILSHKRVLASRLSFWRPLAFSADDVLYESLPLYHGAGLMGVFNVIDQGATVLLKARFSASSFWSDCRRHEVTVIHYIGEMCRYLVAQARREDDGKHNIRVAVGNGLRSDIWEEFQRRFRLPRIVEFYAATEGTASFINFCNRLGALGRCSPLLRKLKLEPSILIKYDVTTSEPVRGADGRCIPVGPGEEGLFVSKLTPRLVFEGYYRRPDDNTRKVLLDVLEPGDRYYNSGDVLYLDQDYFVYFRDRTGDTFRWKGENVSTSEVSNVLNGLPFVHDTNVYGVTVPGCEGRAGMAAIHLKEGAVLGSGSDQLGGEATALGTGQLAQVDSLCREQLPAYARPKFLRLQRQMSLTSTFKQQKTDLVTEGFDPRKVLEPLYVFDARAQSFLPITEDVYEEIVQGKLPL